MKYYDYEWELGPNRILLDSELDVDALGWRAGDYHCGLEGKQGHNMNRYHFDNCKGIK